MEVRHGNQPDSKYTRRHSDRHALPDNRALNWGCHDSDIRLLPHSPLALASVLSRNGGYLDLVPLRDIDLTASTADNPADSPHADTTPVAAKARQRFNLLTRHQDDQLQQQCKKLLVENALVRNKGERQLYLAAGFISWPHKNDDKVRQRAPLLLYPVLLVRIPNEQHYELRLNGDIPEYNTALIQYLLNNHHCKLPDYREDTPLVDFFATVAESIKGSVSLMLEFDVALGNATLHTETHIQTRPAEHILQTISVPEVFHPGLAVRLLNGNTLEQLQAILQLVPNYLNNAADNSALRTHPTEKKRQAGTASLRRYAARITSEGLGNVPFKTLINLPETLEQCTQSILKACQSRTLKLLTQNNGIKARELIRLSGIIELIDKAPEAIESRGHRDLCYASSTLLLRRAQHQARLIEDELEALKDYFYLDKIPAKPQLLSMMNELGEQGDLTQEPELVGAGYFNARRQFMEFSISKPANLTLEHRRSLAQLAKVLRFRELFVNNVEYRAALGPAYKGLRTDWPALIKTSEYCRELAEVLGSESLAAAIIANWNDFRQSYVQELDILQKSAEATRRLLSITGMRMQIQPVMAVIDHAEHLSKRLSLWQKQFDVARIHADKTAAMVLSSFAGDSIDHVLIEARADEIQGRIHQQLHTNQITIEQISETLSWLKKTCHIAISNRLDIDSIAEHLSLDRKPD